MSAVEVGQRRRWTLRSYDQRPFEILAVAGDHAMWRYEGELDAHAMPAGTVERDSEVIPERVRCEVLGTKSDSVDVKWYGSKGGYGYVNSFSYEVWAVVGPLLRDAGLLDPHAEVTG